MNPQTGRQKKTKVLLIIYGDIHFGGVSVLLNNLLANMDKSDLEFTLYSYGRVVDEAIYQKYLDNGVKVILGNEKTYSRKSFAKKLFKIMFFKKYDIVHVNTGALDLTFVSLFIAKICGIKTRIAHSHNSKSSPTAYSRKELRCRKRILRLATCNLACSSKASVHLFGTPDAKLLPNGIDTSRFTFDRKQREKTRRELNVDNKFVIGTVGRMEPVKNQSFILDIAKELKKSCDIAVVIIGDGSLKGQLADYAKELGLTSDVIFVPTNDTVNSFMSAFDAFLLPSLAEGLPIVAIEVQAMDLPIWCSTAVTKQTAITEKIFFLDLEEGVEAWARSIENYIKTCDPEARCDQSTVIRESGYDIVSSSKMLHDIYLN